MSELGDVIIAKLSESASKINNYDQRSAIGMVRSWVDNGRLDTWDAQRHKDMVQYANRDALATALVEIFETAGAERDEIVEALREGRAFVNAPFVDASMLGQKSGKQLLKPGEAKKRRESGEKS